MIDGGAIHNFIDATWVAKRGIATEKFEGFTVAIAGNTSIECNYWIPKLNVTLGNYHMTDSFYVVNVVDTNVVLSLQWLYAIGKYTTDYREMEMEFQGPDGKRVVLRGINTYPPKPVSSQRMEAVLRKGDIEWSAECLVTFRKPPENNTQHPTDIQALLQKHEKVYQDLPAGRPPDRGFEHIIELEEGTQAVITTPYMHPKRYKDEIEKTIKELLELGYIRRSWSLCIISGLS